MKIIFAAVVVLLAVTGPAYGGGKTFESLDKNQDGRISQQEYLDAADKTFDKLDKNSDGVLDQEELKALPKADRKKWTAQMDKNRDGKIDRQEFRVEALKRFQAADADKDRYLDSREWTHRQTRESVRSLNLFSF